MHRTSCRPKAANRIWAFLVNKTDRDVILRDVEDKEIHIPAGDVEQMVKQSKSLMPEQQLRDLTAAASRGFAEFVAIAEVGHIL